MTDTAMVRLWHGPLDQLHLHLQKLNRMDRALLPGKSLSFAIYKISDEHWIYLSAQQMGRFERLFHATFFPQAKFHDVYMTGIYFISVRNDAA
ncbi:hypothetical protein EVC12_089 [Rhizobium phage RHph_I42]|nr:hypothetical protein EVC12_089 [Rhizobium phage RHph_I42]